MQIWLEESITSKLSVINPGPKNVITKLTEYRNQLFDPKILLNIAVRIKNNIFVRTNAGLDKNGIPFKPYSDRYKKQNKKTTVNMTLTGEMMNSMTQSLVSNNAARIFFSTSSARQKAIWHNISGAGKGKIIRNFFGASEMDISTAQKLFIAEANRVKRMKNL